MKPVYFESRVKNPETLVRKIAHHRLKGKKNYDITGVNDAYGGRFITASNQQKQKIIYLINRLAKEGKLKILKQQQVDKDTYHAMHIDFILNGVRGEIQIHDPQSNLEAVVNHDIRAVGGEHPPKPLEKQKDHNAQMADKTPDTIALMLAKGIEEARRGRR